MKWYKKIGIGLATIFVVIQFIRPSLNKGNSSGPQDITHAVPVPDTVLKLLQQACYDCHSNSTQYPWYSYVQPFAWWQAHHVSEGKGELNFTTFASYSKRRQASKAKSIASSIKEESMPLSSYTLVHGEAKLTDEQKTLIIQWATHLSDSLLKEN